MPDGVYQKNHDALVAEIESCKAEIENAGLFRRRDLMRHLRRLERELRDYERFWKGARANG